MQNQETQKNLNSYKPLTGFVVPTYYWAPGRKKEEYWIDLQNLLFTEDLPEGKDWWVLSPSVPAGTDLEKPGWEESIKWFVSFSGNQEDLEKEWDFEKHCPKEEN